MVRYLKPDTVNQKRSDNNKNKPAEEKLAEKTVQNLKKMPPALIVTETPEFKGHTLACQRFITNTCAGKLLCLFFKVKYSGFRLM